MIERILLPGMGVNCYVYYDEDSKKGFIVDPGLAHQRIKDFIEENNIEVEAILLTHGHSDHIMGVNYFRELYNCPVYAHEDEQEILEDPRHNHSTMMTGESMVIHDVNYIKDGAQLEFAGAKIDCLHTPGHTKGGVCYLLGEDVFTGDTLFKLGIGRFDLFSGDYHALENSIRNVLYLLPDETRVHPGHGVQTSIGYEKVRNPYFRDDALQ